MYRKMRRFLFIVAGTAVLAVSLSILIINLILVDQFKEEYQAIKTSQIDYFIEQNFKDLEDILYGHAVWTDTIIAIEAGDYDWLYDNATGYIVDDDPMNIDFIYIADESGNHKASYGAYDLNHILHLASVESVLEDKEAASEVIWLGDQVMILSASPLLDNDEENPTGIYVIGRLLGQDELAQLRDLLSSGYVISMDLDTDKVFSSQENNRTTFLTYDLDPDNSVYLKIKFTLSYFIRAYNLSVVFMMVILMVISLIAVTILTLNIKKLVNKISEVIRSVKEIARGDYHVKISDDHLFMMPEVKDLVQSVNAMSTSISDQIDLVNDHASVINDQYFAMIELLVDTVEMNDSYTYHHSVAVSDYALMIGRRMGFDNLHDLELAAKLHDVGKISIPTEILNKPGKLTDEEFDIIKTHSENGYKLLNKNSQFDRVKEGVLYHHEKYNGSGYPQGLKGDEIPLMAQIISVADVFDALTSDRAYRKALDCHTAMAILVEEKGRALNPMIVDIFKEEMEKRNCLNKE